MDKKARIERISLMEDRYEDYEADEAGQIPTDLKRGVLSEDGLYNLLHDAEQIIAHVKEVFADK